MRWTREGLNVKSGQHEINCLRINQCYSENRFDRMMTVMTMMMGVMMLTIVRPERMEKNMANTCLGEER